MKMKTNKFMTYALSAMMLGSLAACSSDERMGLCGSRFYIDH